MNARLAFATVDRREGKAPVFRRQSSLALEINLCAELDLTHVRLAAAGDCVVDAGNQAGVARGAVDAARVRGAGDA